MPLTRILNLPENWQKEHGSATLDKGIVAGKPEPFNATKLVLRA